MGGRYLSSEQIPTYLQEYIPPPRDEEGIIKLVKREKYDYWVLEGKPWVIAKAKQLFSGISKYEKGRCEFPRTIQNHEELGWFILRYNITIQDIEEWKKDRNKAIEHFNHRKRLADASEKILELPEFNGELFNFQRDALRYLILNNGGLLAYDMGLGKTPISIAYMMELAKKMVGSTLYPFLVVPQPHVILQWVSEIKRFWPGIKVHVINGMKPYRLPKAHIYVIHYLLLRGWENVFENMNFSAIIFDEIQELRRHESEKYRVACKLAQQVQQNGGGIVGLSGTPIYNYGGEIWNIMNILRYGFLGPWGNFSLEWCDSYLSPMVRDPELLGDYLVNEGLILRGKIEDFLVEFPKRMMIVHQIGYDEHEYDRLIDEVVQRALKIPSLDSSFERFAEEEYVFNKVRQIVGLTKVPFAAAFVKSLLDAGECVILYAHHHAVVDRLLEILKKYHPACITGRENLKEKAKSQEAFMSGRTNLIIVSLRSATGLNLQRSHIVVFLELDCCPAVHTQGIGRARRIGQEHTVFAYFLVCDQGTDPVILNMLGLKISQAVGVLKDKLESEESLLESKEGITKHMKEVLSVLAKREGVDYEELLKRENERRRKEKERNADDWKIKENVGDIAEVLSRDEKNFCNRNDIQPKVQLSIEEFGNRSNRK